MRAARPTATAPPPKPRGAYLESVLGNLSAGVITFDNNFIMRAANLGAVGILRSDLTMVDNLPLMEWPIHRQLCDAVLEGFREHKGDWHQQLEIEISEGESRTLLLRGTTLPAAGGAGHVIVFDDITDLLSAQRTAAWGEVARRLAHEIKNPLTPIQLSAERLQHKLADKLAPARTGNAGAGQLDHRQSGRGAQKPRQ